MTHQNLSEIKDLIAHLRGLSDGSINPTTEVLGLCEEVDYFYPQHLKLVTSLFSSWDKSSGSAIAPVPHPFMDSRDAFVNLLDLWGDDEYGSNRRELCLHCANQLELLFPQIDG